MNSIFSESISLGSEIILTKNKIKAFREDIGDLKNLLEMETLRTNDLTEKYENITQLLNETTIELLHRGIMTYITNV